MPKNRSYVIVIRAILEHLPDYPQRDIEKVIEAYARPWRTYHDLDMVAWQIEFTHDLHNSGHIDISGDRLSALICGFIFGNFYFKLDNGAQKKGEIIGANSRFGFNAANNFGLRDLARLVERMISSKEEFKVISDAQSLVEETSAIGWYLDINLLYALGTCTHETIDRVTRLRDELQPTLDFEKFVNSRATWANKQLARSKLFTQPYMQDTYAEYGLKVLRSTQNRQLLAA